MTTIPKPFRLKRSIACSRPGAVAARARESGAPYAGGSERASAGLVVSEATPVSPCGPGYPDTPGIHTREQRDR